MKLMHPLQCVMDVGSLRSVLSKGEDGIELLLTSDETPITLASPLQADTEQPASVLNVPMHPIRVEDKQPVPFDTLKDMAEKLEAASRHTTVVSEFQLRTCQPDSIVCTVSGANETLSGGVLELA